jgi:hypothetical protein
MYGKMHAQDSLPHATFSVRYLKIGEPVRYHLSFYHPKEMELIFPDSKYNYAPFELVSKEFYPTKTSGKISLDSAVYVLRTFELRDTIHYSLPVFIIGRAGDSSAIRPGVLLLDVLQLTKAVKDTNLLKELTGYNPVSLQVNYAYYFFISTLLLVISIFIFFFFRKKIFKRFRLYAIRQSHNSFVKNFEKLEKDFIKTQRLPIMENALSLWKVYLTRLENSPINTYTTTEIIALFHQEELAEGLQIIDKSIYRGMISGEPEKAFTILRKFSNQRYQKIKREIINE